MSTHSQDIIFEALDATWPAARTYSIGPWTIRQGAGGGQRVSAASANGVVTNADVDIAEREMVGLGQRKLFQLKPGDEALDQILDARGYLIRDPVNMYLGHVGDAIGTEAVGNNVFEAWPPLAIQREIWESGGIGPARVAVMERAAIPKGAFLARVGQSAAGVGFVSIAKDIAMIHALEVSSKHRRKGVASQIMTAVAKWAQDMGATHLGLAVTEENFAANALYVKKSMRVVSRYHYRRAPE